VPGSGAPVKVVAQSAEQSDKMGKAANREAHNGRFGAAGEDFGKLLSSAASGIAVADPEAGALVAVAGQGIQAVAKQGEQANVLAHDITDGNLKQAANDAVINPVKGAVNEARQAADAARQGQFSRAANHIGQASNRLSAGSGDGIIDAAKATQSANAQSRDAIQDAKNGRFSAAGEKAGGVLSTVGDAVSQVDSEEGEKFKNSGNEITEKSRNAHEMWQYLRERRHPQVEPIALASAQSSENSEQAEVK